jgi:hypothetical protein
MLTRLLRWVVLFVLFLPVLQLAQPAHAQPAGNFTPSDKPINSNGLVVQVLMVKVEHVPLVRFGGYYSQTQDQELMIKIQIINKTDRQLSYQTWRGDQTGLNSATVQDDQGSQYQPTSPPEGFQAVGSAADNVNIRPGQILGDVLTFQKPNPGARNLYITLPGSNLSAAQDFDFVAPVPAGN